MKRIFPLLLALGLLIALPACGKKDREPTVVSYDSVSQVSQALGYDLLAIEQNSTNLTFSSSAVVDDVIGQVDYETGNSGVRLRMTLDKNQFEGLSGYQNAGKAGGIEAPSDVFSRLELYVVDDSTYFCEFSYTYDSYTCYLSLAETKTTFDAYSILLINYVNQIYNMSDVPNFVYALNPDYGKEVEEDASTPKQEETQSSAESQESEPSSDEAEKEEPKEESKTDQESEAKKTEEKAEDDASSSITLEYYDITLVNVGDAYTFSPSGGDGSYTWKSADSSIAAVSDSGTVTAVGSGETTVTCTSGDLSVDVIVRVQ